MLSKSVISGFRDRVARHAPLSYGAIFLACLLSMLANGSLAATLNDIQFDALPGERVQVTLSLSEPVSEPLSFAIDEPARVALDFPGVSLNTARKTQTIGVGMARSITAVEGGDRTRVVLNLIKLVPYEVTTQGNQVVLTLESAGSTQSRVLTGTGMGASSAVAAQSLENIDFRRGGSGEGRVIVTLSDPSMVIDSREEAGKIVVDFLNASLPERLERTLDVMDFATPVRQVDTYAQGDSVRMVVKPGPNFEFLAYQSDNLFTVEVKPVSEQDVARIRKEKVGYTGERLSLNFQNIEVRAILQLIADFTGLNMVASDSVNGSLTLRLKNVPWDQALDIILKSRGLGMRKTGNVVMVAPSEELAAREKLELESQQQIKELAPLTTEFIQVNYAKAGDISQLISATGNSLLSERGSVTLDARTNTLLVRDTAENLSSIRRMITKLDIPVRQVLIEGRIVIADDTFSKDLGVKFGLSRTKFNGPNNNKFYTIGGKNAGDTEYSTGTVSYNTDNQENYIVDLPIASPGAALGVAIGKIGSYLLQLELQAMQAEGRGEVISSPRVITSNQKEALIEQGTEIPYQEASSSGSTSVAFKKAVLSLKVTPQITPDDRIIMDLNINKDAVGAREVVGVPTVDTREIQTQVLVDNGETVVLGGVYEQTKQNRVNRIPFFSDLPIVGHLFKQTSDVNDKSELLVFVTPIIVKDSLAVR